MQASTGILPDRGQRVPVLELEALTENLDLIDHFLAETASYLPQNPDTLSYC